MKWNAAENTDEAELVALRGRAWIEISVLFSVGRIVCVALRGRAWIEMCER